MQRDTHRMGGMFFSAVGFVLLKDNGLLLQDVNLFTQWLLIYPFCQWGSTSLDLDHHWASCPSKDYPSYMINKALHLTRPIEKKTESNKSSNIYKLSHALNARHRSWQTHSEFILVILLLVMSSLMHGRFFNLGAVDVAVLRLALTGLCLGTIAHLFLDMLTTDGIHLLVGKIVNKLLFKGNHVLPEHLRLVPKKVHFFSSEKWEKIAYKIMRLLTVLSVIYMLYVFLIPFLPFEIGIN